MKTIRIRFLATALIGSAMIYTINAEKIQFEQLPIELKDKIRVHTGSARVEDVDRQTKGGQTTYEVAFKKNGEHTELMFNERGELIQPASGTAALDSRKISYNELPEIVKKAADARLKKAEINDVDRQVRDGKATYEIGFKENGQQQELVVSQDGRILNDSESVAVGAAASSVIGRGSSTTTSLVPEPVTLSSSRKIELSQAPAAVQKAITAAANGARIEDLERGTWQGRNVYQAAFKENGKNIELQVREDGAILHDPRKTGTRSAVRGSARSPYASVTSLVPLSSSEKVDREELPVTLKRRLNARIGNQRIEDIERGTWQGKTIYQIAFKDAQGQHVELQLDENGAVVFDPRTR